MGTVPFYSQKVNWAGEDSGFPGPEAVAEWETNCCGMACARMVIHAFTGQAPRYWDLLQEGLARKAYCEAGWIHRGLVDLIGSHGVSGVCHRSASVADLFRVVEAGGLAIASVTPEFRGGEVREDGRRAPRGGHLVVVVGAGPQGLVCHHPSTLEGGNREAWLVDTGRWELSFSGNFMEFPRSGNPPLR